MQTDAVMLSAFLPQTSEPMEQPITSCAFNYSGQFFAYSVSYDWSKVSFVDNTVPSHRAFSITTGLAAYSLLVQGCG